jgi:exosortase/archaeosortase family protein
VFQTNPPDASSVFHIEIPAGSFQAPRFLLLVLFLTLFTISADQFAAPLLHSSSPLWATAACLVLVWRRSEPSSDADSGPIRFSFTFWRFAAFVGTHAALILVVRSLSSKMQLVAGTVTMLGALFAVMKLSVLAPTILLLPVRAWRELLSPYRAEIVAALVVLLTYFPSRAIEELWPWYGQALGRFVYALSSIFAHRIGYIGNSNPTLTGPDLDVTVILACSGINGIELFDYLFGGVAILDWNRLRKGRALAGYFLGLFAMLLGNALRITSLVVFGNRGFAELVAHYHIAAGWIFFSVVFLVYLSMTYAWMLKKKSAVLPEPRMAQPNSFGA